MKGLPAKVSLIVPVYNVEKYIGRCLESCLEQTLNDLEIILIDDGSTDNSGIILDQYKDKDPRFFVIHKENGGLSSARNAGLDVASGEWIMFLDSDDYLVPNACECVWTETQEEPTEIIVFGTNYFPSYPEPSNKSWLDYTFKVETARFYSFSPDILFNTPGGNPYVWRHSYSSSLLKRYDVHFDETVAFGEDMLFQLSVFPHAQKISFISDVLYNYRIGRVGSLMDEAEKKPVEKMNWHIEIVDRAFREWENQGILEKYSLDILSWAVDYVIHNLYLSSLSDKMVIVDKFYNVIDKYNMTPSLNNISTERRILLQNIENR